MSGWTAQARPGLAEGALDDLGPLLRRRLVARDAPSVTRAGLAEIDERIAALSAAVVACGVTAETLKQTLESGDPELALAIVAVAPDLPLPGPWWQQALAVLPPAWWPVVVDHTLRWHPPALVALCTRGLATTPTGVPLRWLLECLLALHGRPAVSAGGPLAACLKSGLVDPSPTVRALAWEVIARRGETVDARSAQLGMRDPEAAVRQACVEALVWMSHPSFVQEANHGLVRRTAADHEVILQWARLTTADAAPPLVRVAMKPGQGVLCVPLLSTIALPLVVPALITLMDPRDVPLAVAAGRAFHLLTGVQIDSAQRVTLPPGTGQAAEELDQDLLATAWLPDPERAQRRWADLSPTLDPGRRLSAGRMVGEGDAANDPAISTAAWRSAAMRAVYIHGERRPAHS